MKPVQPTEIAEIKELAHRTLKSKKVKQQTATQMFIEFSETNQYQTI